MTEPEEVYEPNLIGLCGRPGAGKTTVEKYISEPVKFREIVVNNRLNFVESVLQNHVTKEQIAELITKYIDSKLAQELDVDGEYKVYIRDIKNMSKNMYNAMSFAEPLKIIASVIFNYDFNILLGNTAESRKQREVKKTRKYDVCGSMTGRKCLEFLGTDLFRDKIDQDIWLDIAMSTIDKYMEKGYSICISDVRYENEYYAIKLKAAGEIWVIYRKDADFKITEEDLKTHISRYGFLKFINIDQDVFIPNAGTLAELKSTVYNCLDWLE